MSPTKKPPVGVACGAFIVTLITHEFYTNNLCNLDCRA